MTVISNFLSPLSPSSLYIKAGHPLAFSFPFSLTSMPRSLEYFSESPAFQFYSFIKATQQPLLGCCISKKKHPVFQLFFFLFTCSIILPTSGSLKREAPVKNCNHSSWAEDLKVKRRSGNTNVLLFSPLLPLILSFSFLSCTLSPPALIILVWLTSRGHSLGSFQHTDPVDLSFR